MIDEGDPQAAQSPAEQNVQTVADLHASEQQAASAHQRRLETLTAALGRPRTLYVMLAVIAVWVLSNMFAPRLGRRPFDPPPFAWLQGIVGLSALLVTTLVLITQNRQGRSAERRALLDLHINLLAEQKATKLIQLIEELRRDLPNVGDRHDAQAEALTQPTDPRAVIATLEQSIEHAMANKVEPAVRAEVRQEVEQALENEVDRAARESGGPAEDDAADAAGPPGGPPGST